MVAPLEQPAPHATLEQDQRDAATATENSGRDHGAADIADADPGEAICAPGSAPSVTSRISVQKVCSLVGKFNKFKRDLVEEIGFGGMLGIKMLAKLNLKFSAWLMERVDVESSTLKIDEQRVLQIQDHDVQKVFSLPCGTRSICPDTTEPSEACKEFMRASAYLSKGAHSLKAAEAYLLRDDINGDSSNVQIDCFKIAFVIFVVGHLLAPSTKHDYITIDFWAALNDISQIKEFNWCAYVLEHLNRAVGKLKTDIRNRNITVHLVGCHLFLQVFYLDNLDLGPLSKTKDHLPRISLFDYESVKKMIEVITSNVDGDTSFAGASFRRAQDVCYSRVHCESHTHRADVASDLPHHAPGFVGTKHQHNPITPMLRSSFTETGQEDFSNHLRLKYPSLADHPLMTILEEHNAHMMENISEIRRSCEVAMSTLADKLLGYISENRCCCRAVGRTDCLLRSPHTIHGHHKKIRVNQRLVETDLQASIPGCSTNNSLPCSPLQVDINLAAP
ncbi:uncharacterized protein [Triticum aestivum]|uniref:Aminotransferase-like plant mobile domain-containing protein n=1 Tax=Triticum turgidum subsp. durum TaxID=4567 RepID=A0A9R1QIN8_TRITD|nr:uncharacterized protein LOC123070290 isoform X2 [Triticum aestivum]VAH78106.1 unnamed protein product [Triticum turgidum subsp. durum]